MTSSSWYPKDLELGSVEIIIEMVLLDDMLSGDKKTWEIGGGS